MNLELLNKFLFVFILFIKIKILPFTNNELFFCFGHYGIEPDA